MKETKTAQELQTEISDRLGGLEVTVYDDILSSWTAAVTVPPTDVANHQLIGQIVQIISELRAKFDLREEPETADLVDSEAMCLSGSQE